jgi:ech hydrogenase subunit D
MMTVNEVITIDNMIEKIASLLPRHYRFVTMTAVDVDTHFDLYYHFDLDYELTTLLLKLDKGAKLPSISGICPPALVVENEIQDLFGIVVSGLNLDYRDHFLLATDAPARPFCRVPGVSVSIVETEKTGGEK